MHKLFSLVLILLISTLVFAEEAQNVVIFKTAESAPSGFTSWTFHWSMPEIDPDATLEYVVLQPDGEEYYRMSIPGTIQTGQEIRSDFYVDFAGGNPEVFYGNEILFMFTVDNGIIQFADDASFSFEFNGTTIDAVR